MLFDKHVELQNKTDDFNDTFMNVMPLKGIATLCFVISNNKKYVAYARTVTWEL
jgi:hypothetical protein